MDDDAIFTLVRRLARPHKSGGTVIERAAILAEGGDFDAVMAWIIERDGVAEEAAAPKANRGLHSPRLSGGSAGVQPLRFVLPAAALADRESAARPSATPAHQETP